MASSSFSQQQHYASPRDARKATKTLLDLPHELLAQHIVAHPSLDGAARLALFQSCHALARMVLQHAPGRTILSHEVAFGSDHASGWPATLAHLLGKWQPPAIPSGLHLRVHGPRVVATMLPLLPSPPPPAIAHHVSNLRLSNCTAALAAWRLHDAALWPQLQHLTITDCNFGFRYSFSKAQPSAAAAADDLPPLPHPIPRLASFTWTDTLADSHHWRACDTLLPLAAYAATAHVDLSHGEPRTTEKVVGSLSRLTHLYLNGRWNWAVAEALLQHPALRHLELGGPDFSDIDLSQQPCQWRTLTLAGGVLLDQLTRLPLANLERLTIHGRLQSLPLSTTAATTAEGLALLQLMQSGGRLVFAPASKEDYARRDWRLLPDAGFFTLKGAPQQLLDLLMLVLEAGLGVDTLQLSCTDDLTLEVLREEVAPVLQRHGGKVTLCFEGCSRQSVEWYRGLLGALPPCVRAVRVHPLGWAADRLKALVEGGVASVRHPLTLTVLCSRLSMWIVEWQQEKDAEAELRQLLGQGQHGLSLEVIRT